MADVRYRDPEGVVTARVTDDRPESGAAEAGVAEASAAGSIVAGSGQPGRPGRPGRPGLRITPRTAVQVGLVLLDIAIPTVSFYVLRTFGVSAAHALIAGAVLSAISAGVSLLRNRRLNTISLFFNGLTLMALFAAFVGGSERFLLAKDGFFTGVGGIGFLLSLVGGKPLPYLLSRPVLQPWFRATRGRWDALWDSMPRFRRIWRVETVIWGIALIGDSALRIVMAYGLPVDSVPALNIVQYVIFTALMLVVVNIYHALSGLNLILAGVRRS